MNDSIFSGLEDMGLGDLQNIDIYHNDKSEDKEAKEEAAPQINEEDMLFDKSYSCPVCEKEFKSRALRAAKARLLGTDADLRAKFEGIEPLKYDVIQCPKCGYAALMRYFKPMPSVQRKLILEKITANYKKREEYKSILTYEDAISRYKLALANAVVKMARASEKAYICLRAGWLVRSYSESLFEEEETDMDKVKALKGLEDEFLKNAYEGFINARQAESYPMCGMDESTVDYLIANLALRFQHYDVASKIVSNLLVSPSCNKRIKDKARDLKEELLQKIHNSKS